MEEDVVCTPKREDGPWTLPSPLCSGYRGLFQGLKRPGRDVEHSSLAPRSRMSGAVPPLFLLYPPCVDNDNVIFTFESCTRNVVLFPFASVCTRPWLSCEVDVLMRAFLTRLQMEQCRKLHALDALPSENMFPAPIGWETW